MVSAIQWKTPPSVSLCLEVTKLSVELVTLMIIDERLLPFIFTVTFITVSVHDTSVNCSLV